jgi:hypothetical protein
MQEVRQIRVLLAREGDFWVAQCLEYDIGAQAHDLDALRKRLMVALEAERLESIRRHGKPFAGIAPAPQSIYERWEHRAGVFTPTQPTTLSDNPDIKFEFGVAA